GSAALTALALLAAYVITVQANLTHQAQEAPAIVSKENPISYTSNGIFKIYDPKVNSDDAGLLITNHNAKKIINALNEGKSADINYDSKRNIYSATMNIG